MNGNVFKAGGVWCSGRNLTPKQWQRYLPDEPYQKTCPQYPKGGGWEKVWFKEKTMD